MNKRIAIVFLFAVTIALTTSIVVYRMLVNNASETGSKVSRGFVAARDLPLGTVIRDEDLKEAELPTSGGNVTRREDVVGRGVLANIYSGEPILEARLTSKGAGGGLAGIIPPGMRAAAVHVNEVVGVSGFVRPGMHVDVITSGAPPDSSQRNVGVVARTVLQNIAVLSAGQDLQKDAEGKPVTVQVVNLLVNPEQAEILSLASTEAKVQLILRNPLDKELTKTPGTTTASLLSVTAAPAPQYVPVRRAEPKKQSHPVAIAPTPIVVEVVNGTKKDSVTVGYSATPQVAGGAQ